MVVVGVIIASIIPLQQGLVKADGKGFVHRNDALPGKFLLFLLLGHNQPLPLQLLGRRIAAGRIGIVTIYLGTVFPVNLLVRVLLVLNSIIRLHVNVLLYITGRLDDGRGIQALATVLARTQTRTAPLCRHLLLAIVIVWRQQTGHIELPLSRRQFTGNHLQLVVVPLQEVVMKGIGGELWYRRRLLLLLLMNRYGLGQLKRRMRINGLGMV